MIVSILCGVLFSEIIGYFVHRLMHNEKIPWLSKKHMEHHLKIYPPRSAMRRKSYIYPSHTTKLGIGLEWLIPVAIILCIIVLCLTMAGISAFHQTAFIVFAVGWTLLMLHYLHGGMHITGFWLSRNSFLKAWFLSSQKLHDIHHLTLKSLFLFILSQRNYRWFWKPCFWFLIWHNLI